MTYNRALVAWRMERKCDNIEHLQSAGDDLAADLKKAEERANLDPWPLAYADGSRARNFEGGLADHLSLNGVIQEDSEIGPGLLFQPRLGFEQDISKYHGVGED